MDDKDKHILRRNLPEFTDTVEPMNLLRHITCLSTSNEEKIRNYKESANGSRPEASYYLHDCLIRRPEGFEQLVRALCKSDINLYGLADKLDPDKLYHSADKLDPQPVKSQFVTVPTHTPSTSSAPAPGRRSKQPVTLETTWKQLPVGVHNILKKLDSQASAGIGPDKLAEYECIDLDREEYDNLKKVLFQDGSFTIAIIDDWNEKTEGSITLGMLYYALVFVGCVDVIKEIESKSGVKCPKQDTDEDGGEDAKPEAACAQNGAEGLAGTVRCLDEHSNKIFKEPVSPVEKRKTEFQHSLVSGSILENTGTLDAKKGTDRSLETNRILHVRPLQLTDRASDQRQIQQSVASGIPSLSDNNYSGSNFPQPAWADKKPDNAPGKEDALLECEAKSKDTLSGDQQEFGCDKQNFLTGVLTTDMENNLSKPTSIIDNCAQLTEKADDLDQTSVKEKVPNMRYANNMAEFALSDKKTVYDEKKMVEDSTFESSCSTMVETVKNMEKPMEANIPVQLTTLDDNNIEEEIVSNQNQKPEKDMNIVIEEDNSNCVDQDLTERKEVVDVNNTDRSSASRLDMTVIPEKPFAATDEVAEVTSNRELHKHEVITPNLATNANCEATERKEVMKVPKQDNATGHSHRMLSENVNQKAFEERLQNGHIECSSMSSQYTLGQPASQPNCKGMGGQLLSCEGYIDHSLEDQKKNNSRPSCMNYTEEKESIERKALKAEILFRPVLDDDDDYADNCSVEATSLDETSLMFSTQNSECGMINERSESLKTSSSSMSQYQTCDTSTSEQEPVRSEIMTLHSNVSVNAGSENVVCVQQHVPVTVANDSARNINQSTNGLIVNSTSGNCVTESAIADGATGNPDNVQENKNQEEGLKSLSVLKRSCKFIHNVYKSMLSLTD